MSRPTRAAPSSISSSKGRRVKLQFFTIGHSNRSLEEFVRLLSQTLEGFRGREPIPSSTRIAFPRPWRSSRFHTNMFQLSADFVQRREPCLRTSMASGRESFHNLPTMRFRRRFTPASSICSTKEAHGVARSYVRKRCGGDVIGASLPSLRRICSRSPSARPEIILPASPLRATSFIM